jgi:hypothetical protein
MWSMFLLQPRNVLEYVPGHLKCDADITSYICPIFSFSFLFHGVYIIQLKVFLPHLILHSNLNPGQPLRAESYFLNTFKRVSIKVNKTKEGGGVEIPQNINKFYLFINFISFCNTED